MKVIQRSFAWITFALLLTLHSFAESPTSSFLQAKQLLDDGSTLGDTSLVLQARRIFLDIYNIEKSSISLYFVAQSELELVRIGMAFDNTRLFDAYYDSALSHAKKVLEENPQWSEAPTLVSLLYCYRIARSPLHAVTLGPKSYYLAEDALKLDSNNPRAWFVAGIIRLHMPSLLGGGTDAAIPFFTTAIELSEKERGTDPFQPTWGSLDARIWLGWALQKDGRMNEALKVYAQAISYEPRAKWISSMFIEPLKEKSTE